MAKNKKNMTAAVVWMLSIFGTLVALMSDKKDNLVMEWGKEALAFFLVSIAVTLLSTVLLLIPVLGWIVGGLMLILYPIMAAILYVWGAWKAYNGEKPNIPIVHKLAMEIKL
ncbi:MAG: DUF4870 domain-containing protein [Candidatus Altiarchaeota archaeon]|nr:DUF4870 domain-containing protein [Candidatus Altiarchaeota archaeon]